MCGPNFFSFQFQPVRRGGGGLKSLKDFPDTPAPFEQYFHETRSLYYFYFGFVALIAADAVYYYTKMKKDSNGKLH